MKHSDRIVKKTLAAPINIALDERKCINNSELPELACAVFLTNKCLAACAHCFNNSGPKGELFLDKDTVYQFINWLSKKSLNEKMFVGLTGGEPFLHPDIFDLMRTLKHDGHFVSCTTGLQGVTTDDLFQASKTGLDRIAISWDKFHAKFVSLQRVIDSANAPHKSCDVVIQIGTTKNENHDDLIEHLLQNTNNNVRIDIFDILPIGRGLKLSQDLKKINSFPASNQKVTSLNFNGKVYQSCELEKFTPNYCLGEFNELKNAPPNIITDGAS